MPPQNAYDDPDFFAGYSRLERFGPGWTKAFEHPSFMALLPDVAGRRVLDLGCGAGQLAHHLAARGAADVIGVDISERMLGLARAERSHPRVTYVRESIEQVTFAAVASLLNGLIDAGLSIERVLEPVPSEEQLSRRPDWVHERRRPFCLLVRAGKATA